MKNVSYMCTYMFVCLCFVTVGEKEAIGVERVAFFPPLPFSDYCCFGS